MRYLQIVFTESIARCAEQLGVTEQQIPIAEFEDPNLDPNAEYLGAYSLTLPADTVLTRFLLAQRMIRPTPKFARPSPTPTTPTCPVAPSAHGSSA